MHVTSILVVDDEPQIRRVLRATLSSNGYEVIEAKDGQEVVEMVVTERPELIRSQELNFPS
jgi:two-component system, OmpR family, KDP operon response regulator KdpE